MTEEEWPRRIPVPSTSMGPDVANLGMDWLATMINKSAEAGGSPVGALHLFMGALLAMADLEPELAAWMHQALWADAPEDLRVCQVNAMAADFAGLRHKLAGR